MLNAQRPVFNVGGTKIAVHGEGVARTWVRWSVPALNESRDASGINLGLLINPVKAPRTWCYWDVDPGAENVSNGRRSDRNSGPPRSTARARRWGWASDDRRPSGNDGEPKDNGTTL